MKKIILFSICTLLTMSLYAQVYTEEMEDSHYLEEAPPSLPVVPPNVQFSTLNFKGTFSHSANSNGFMSVRVAAFYNDIAYMISGDGKKILMTNSSGVPVTNPFASLTFNYAQQIYADDEHVIVLDRDALKGYSKTGQLRFSISLNQNYWFRYFWVRNKQEIMLVSRNRIEVYDYSTRIFLRGHMLVNEIRDIDNLRNDGNKMYNFDSSLITYEFRGGSIQERDITTSEYRSWSRENYLAAFVGKESLWFNYDNRSQAFFVDSGFNRVVRNINFLPASKNPTFDDIVNESGNPMLRVYYSQGKVYVINIRPHAVEFYRLE